MMEIIVDKVYVDGIWLGVGSNMPWGIPGTIKEITIYQDDPRNFYGCDTDFIEVFFDSKKKLAIKTREYICT